MALGTGSQAGRDRAFTGFFTLLATAVSCAVIALSLPRAIEPNTLPALTLEPAAVREALARDRAVSARDVEHRHAPELRALYLAQGLADVQETFDADRKRRLHLFSDALTAEQRDTLRVQATERALSALFERADAPRGAERTGLLGHFPTQLAESGLRAKEGTWIAPELTVRAAYKVRWNLVHGRPRDEGLSRVERQAFHGFLALHGRGLPPTARSESAQEFYDAGGRRSAEAYAVWLFQGGLPEQGLTFLERAMAQREELRTRNMRIAMLLALHQEIPR